MRKERNPASPDAPAESEEGFLSRWSRRKSEARQPAPPAPEPAAGQAPGAAPPGGEPERVLTDADMPPLDSLGPDSDYSPFWSPGVSEELRRVALRKLFGSPQFNIRDGLDDYDDDYTIFEPLRKTVAEALQEHGRAMAGRAGEADAPADQAAEAGGGEPSAPAERESGWTETADEEPDHPGDDHDAPGARRA